MRRLCALRFDKLQRDAFRYLLLMLTALQLCGCQELSELGQGVSSNKAPVQPSPLAQALATPALEHPLTPSKRPLLRALRPLPASHLSPPRLTQKVVVSMVTTVGTIGIEVYPEAAPRASKRFLELAASGFYNGVPISRVVREPEPFIAQFGVNWRKTFSKEREVEFPDEPSFFALDKGTLAFAKAGKDHNSTQVFINYRNNDKLAAPPYGFTAFAKVVKGMDVVEKFPAVGDPAAGLDQYRLWLDGEAYIDSLSLKPAVIENMTLVTPWPAESK